MQGMAPTQGRVPPVVSLTLAALFSVQAGPVWSLPPGRAWTAVDTLSLPQFETLTAPRLDTDASGVPVLFGSIFDSGGNNAGRFDWADSSWELSWLLGQGANFLWPVLSPPGEIYLLWRGADLNTRNYLFFARAFRDSASWPDTVARVDGSANMYSAAVTPTRTWVVVSDWVPQTSKYQLRLLYSTAPASWREIPVEGDGNAGVAVAALDDTSALVVWAGDNAGLRWGVARGQNWSAGPNPLAGTLSNSPRLRPRPIGGHWLIWATKYPYIGMASNDQGSWSEPESLRCAYADSIAIYPSSDSDDLSRDGAEYPVVAWSAFSTLTGISTICVSVPTDSGYGLADEIRSPADDIGAQAARDRNGDAWVAFWSYSFDGIFWAHTYTKAISTPPTVTTEANGLQVSWTLSEPSPETWWAVLRSENQAPFETRARVRAGSSVQMSWVDMAAPNGIPLRYRIRRESVDARFRWETSETVGVVGQPVGGKLRLSIQGANPLAGRIEILVQGAARGSIELGLFDLQGRRILSRSTEAGGSGRDSVSIDLRGDLLIPSGVYWIKGIDAQGRISEPVKLVYLR